jgi:hypothetical protein
MKGVGIICTYCRKPSLTTGQTPRYLSQPDVPGWTGFKQPRIGWRSIKGCCTREKALRDLRPAFDQFARKLHRRRRFRAPSAFRPPFLELPAPAELTFFTLRAGYTAGHPGRGT